ERSESKGRVEYIKIPHHGSKNGLTQELLEASNPEVAVISVGKNSYGHPHKETLDLLARCNLQVFRTDEVGDVEVVSDGDRFWVGK
ncbi:MBL fold metallo-hydrolase, partial [Patescibacteria group bacterium]|nr:MBL fold metallo-hydrolase [Patescibacteria group bacterium]